MGPPHEDSWCNWTSLQFDVLRGPASDLSQRAGIACFNVFVDDMKSAQPPNLAVTQRHALP